MKIPKKILMVSFHFPPIAESSGYLRAFKFSKFLPQYNIIPTVLTIRPKAYTAMDKNNYLLLNQLSKDVSISRAYGFDNSKTFSFKGKYLGLFTIPDRWSSWIPFAIFKGWKLHKKNTFDGIWATYPISSSLIIGWVLASLLKKPLYIDLRDPVWEEETWQGTLKQKALKWLEFKVISKAKNVIFTSPGTIKKYKERYERYLQSKFVLIANGFDEDDFQNLPQIIKPKKALFLHSGLLPKYERDPAHFFQAIAELKQESLLNSSEVVFRLRATGENNKYKQLVSNLGIDDLVEIAEQKEYKYAISEMFTADVLMVFQHRTCDWQTPAKLFEYFRVGKPLLLLTGSNSDTLKLAKRSGSQYCTSEIDNVNEIKQAIASCLTNKETPLNTDNYSRYSRKEGAKSLALLIKEN